jgi:hypothetical protein
MQWYYSKNATQLGPISLDELRAKFASGEVSGTDMVWREGMTDWKPASSVPELFAPVVSPQPAELTGGTTNSPYTPPTTTSVPAYGMVVPNYLWQSIVVTILCCWPLGIPAIVYAAKVDGLKARGDVHGAIAASNSAKNWCLAALGGWIVIVVIYVLFAVISVGVSHGSR